MTSPRRKLLSVVAALSVATTVAACMVDRSGPLDFGDGEDCTGIPRDDQGRMTLGHRVATNTGSRPVTITGISLVDADNITFYDAALIPSRGTDWGLAVGSGFPPPNLAEERWKEGLPAVDSQIEPNGSYGFLVGLQLIDPDEPASSGGFEVEYTDDTGRRYRAEVASEIGIDAKCPGFDSDPADP